MSKNRAERRDALRLFDFYLCSQTLSSPDSKTLREWTCAMDVIRCVRGTTYVRKKWFPSEPPVETWVFQIVEAGGSQLNSHFPSAKDLSDAFKSVKAIECVLCVHAGLAELLADGPGALRVAPGEDISWQNPWKSERSCGM